MKRNAAGDDLGTVDLEPTVFGLTPNRALLHQVVTAQLAAARAGTQSTKTRAEVRGGGAKPFRQKGTGRARQGSSRSPSMSGGGVALGPKPRSYAQRTPKKMVRLALLSALSDMAEREGRRADRLGDRRARAPGRRRDAREARASPARCSCVLANDEIDVALSLRNIPEASITTHAELSAHDVVAPTGSSSPSARCRGRRRTSPARTSGRRRPADPPVQARRRRRARRQGAAKKAAKATKAAKPAEATKAPAKKRPATKATEARRGREGAEAVDAEAGSSCRRATRTPRPPRRPRRRPRRPRRDGRAAKKAKEGDDDA